MTWSGKEWGESQITRAPTDLMREVNAGFALVMDYVIETPAKETTTPRFGCGLDCSGLVDVTNNFGINQHGGMSNFSVPLNYFRDCGVDFSRIDTFSLSSEAALEIILARIALVPSINGSRCNSD